MSYNMFPPCHVFLLNDNVLLMQRLVHSIALIDLNLKAHVVVEAPSIGLTICMRCMICSCVHKLMFLRSNHGIKLLRKP